METDDADFRARLGELGSSFGNAAADYAAHRPDYPDAAVAWALEPLGSAPRIVDLAAGTGKLTAGLARAGGAVIAVEPDAAMLAEVPATIAARVRAGAEAIPLRTGSVDAVTVGQAFHWFDGDAAMAEIARVLRPGGVLTALWNYFDDSIAWVREFDEIVSSARWWARQDRGSNVPAHDAFAPAQRREFRHAHRRTAESLVRTAGTHSHVLTLPADQRDEAIRRLRTVLAAHEETRAAEFDLPIITTAVRLIRH